MTSVDTELDFVDLFCGAGGSSTGLTTAGWTLKLAANHWDIAIQTHSANHPTAEHLCEDINKYDMRRIPKARALWGSPICTEISPSGGKKRIRRTEGQIALMEEGAVPDAAFERTRATAYDIIRATEVHRYEVVMCENVVEFATDWELFDWWITGMVQLGYNFQIVSASSAHLGGEIGNPLAPQWRDRIYIVFTRKGIRIPDVRPTPAAWCQVCDEPVAAVQTWRTVAAARRIGKYKQQYDYRCPNDRCSHALVEPYVAAAASIIDWDNLGTRIGDRKKPLAANTMRRIEAGLRMFPTVASMITVNHSGHDGRAFSVNDRPLPARTVKIGEGLLVPCGGGWNDTPSWTGHPARTRMANEKGYEGLFSPPFIIEYRNHATAAGVDDPLATVTAGGNHHGLVIPDGAFYVKNYGGKCSPENNVGSVDDPFGTITARDGHSLVIPYRDGNLPTLTDQPIHALSTRDSAALVTREVSIDDCHFRMLQPREQMLAQRFPREYIMHGNKGEQTMQAGNSVSVNAAQWLGTRVAEVLDAA